jgi:hypothetical protein
MNRDASKMPIEVAAIAAPASYGIAGIAIAVFVAAIGLLLNFV